MLSSVYQKLGHCLDEDLQKICEAINRMQAQIEQLQQHAGIQAPSNEAVIVRPSTATQRSEATAVQATVQVESNPSAVAEVPVSTAPASTVSAAPSGTIRFADKLQYSDDEGEYIDNATLNDDAGYYKLCLFNDNEGEVYLEMDKLPEKAGISDYVGDFFSKQPGSEAGRGIITTEKPAKIYKEGNMWKVATPGLVSINAPK